MSNDEKRGEILKKLESVEKRLKKIEKDSKIGLEDQLFFGIVFSLLILFLTMPMAEVVIFFQNVFLVPFELSVFAADVIKFSGIIFMLLSSLMRYYGAMSGGKVSKEARHLSIILTLISFELIITLIVLNITQGIAIQTRWITFPLGMALLAFAFRAMYKFEIRLFNFYASKGLISRKGKMPIMPIVSPIFFFMCFSLYAALLVGAFVIFFVPYIFNEFLIQISFVIFFLIQFLLYFFKKKQKK